MWENKNTKLFGKGKKKKAPIRMSRTRGEIKISGGLGSGPPLLIPARLILTDFRAKGIDLFSAEDIDIGREISLTIDGPRKFYCRGEIIARQEVRSASNIIREEQFNYRIGIRFIFDSKEEEDSAHNFACEVTGVGKLREIKVESEEASAEAQPEEESSGTEAVGDEEAQAA